jgi:tRNA(fMet)-specific endonuclease VapC
MLLLDTDHLVEYQKGTSPDSRRLKERLDSAAESYGTTIVTVEEIMRGWMAAIRRIQDVRRQVNAYTNAPLPHSWLRIRSVDT